MWRIYAYFFVFSAAATSINAEEKIYSDQEFRDWAAFIDGEDCWIASFPQDENGEAYKSIFVFVTFHHHNPRPKISIAIDETNSGEARFSTENQQFSLPFRDDTAFPAYGEDIKVLKTMLSREPAKIEFTRDNGDSFIGHVSHEGFQQAYNYTSKACEFYFNEDLDDNKSVEPA